MKSFKKWMKLLSILSLLFYSIHVEAQDSLQFTKVLTLDQKATHIATDNFGNCFFINDLGFKKVDFDNQLEFQYSDESLSQISSIDVTDPLKILVFYKDLSKIVLLDNTLSKSRDDIYLENHNLDQCIFR